MTTEGQHRIIIEGIQPQVDGGAFPAKRTVGERVDVSATILGDGHDHIRAELCFRFGDGAWAAVPMSHAGNDVWTASFDVSHKGTHFFAVRAWIDHLETWHDGFMKKAAAGLDVSVELLEGAVLLQQIEGGDASIKEWSRKLGSPSSGKDSIDLIMSSAFQTMVTANPLRQFVTMSKSCEVKVDGERARFSTWYELFPRSTSNSPGVHGTFQDTIKLLPRLSAMHFDVLYLPPIHPIGKVNRKGKNNNVMAKAGEPGSPWAIGNEEGGHKSILKELGTMDDFRKLIKEAGKLDIQIAMDIAFQCAPDHPYVTAHPGWFRKRPDGSIQYAENPPKKYQDIYPFDFECEDWKGLWEELKSVFVFWIEQGVTIFRVDNPHTKPFPFWAWVIAEINKKYPDIIFLSEAFTRPKVMAALAKLGFTQSYTYFTWRVSKQEITEYMTELVSAPSRNYFRPNFWPNTPDILPWHLQHQGENAFILRFALAATLSSNYGMYGPAYEICDNVPMDGKEEYFNSEKYEIKTYDWKKSSRMTEMIRLVNKTRKENPAMQSTWNISFCSIENPNMVAYLKATDDLKSIMLIIVNLDPNQKHSGYVQLPLSRLHVQRSLHVKLVDQMTGEKYAWMQEWNFVELDPNRIPFHLFKLELNNAQM